MSMHTKSTEESSIKHRFQAMTNLAIVHLQELDGASSVIRDVDFMMATGKAYSNYSTYVHIW
jgi:hypothetical protein